MITKSKIWYLTLSSLILVLIVYYVVTPFEDNSKSVFSSDAVIDSVSINESETLTAMEVYRDEDREKNYDNLEELLLDDSKSIIEKNEVIEKIQYLKTSSSLEENLKKQIKKEYNYNSFIEVNNNSLTIVLDNIEKSDKVANELIKYVCTKTDNSYYVTVKFE